MKRLQALAAVALLAGCAATPPPAALPALDLPPAYAAGSSAGAKLGTQWWTLFDDAVLNQLVETALAKNNDLRLAAARAAETATLLGLARAAQWPGVDLGASAIRSRSSSLGAQPLPPGGAESTSHRLALSTSFEIDLWGRLRNASAAAQAQLLAAEHARDTVRLAVAGGTVQSYFGLRALDAQLAVIEAQQGARRDSLQIVERRLEAGLASTLEQAQARSALAATAAQQPELRRQRAVLAHQLGVLTAQPGLTLAARGAALPTPVTVPAGLPSALLVQRPDVQQAEASLRAAQAQVEVARAALLPTLSLTGSLGQQSADLLDLLKTGARVWSLGPSLLLPLFDGGRNQARSEQAQLQAEQAAIGYQKVAQTAFREVANALAGAEHGRQQEADAEQLHAAAGDALRLGGRTRLGSRRA